MGNTSRSMSTPSPTTQLNTNQIVSLQQRFKRKLNNQQINNSNDDTANVSRFAEHHLGKLSPDHYRLGKLLLQPSHLFGCPEGLETLWSCSTFIFTRKSARTRDGFGFHVEIGLMGDEEEGKFVAFQKLKPKRNWFKTDNKDAGLPDGPIDVFDAETERQVLGIVLNKNSSLTVPLSFQGSKIFCVPGVIGVIVVKGDWTTSFEIKNVKDEVILTADRFNRISGGLEFQISSVSKGDIIVCVATLVRLEESKFILKIYAPFPPIVKALLISFVTFLMYLLAR